MRYVTIIGLLMCVACGIEGDPGTDTDAADGGLEPGAAGMGTGALDDLMARLRDQDAGEEPGAAGMGSGALDNLMARLRDQDAGEEPGEPDAGTGADADAGPADADVGHLPETDPEKITMAICDTCVGYGLTDAPGQNIEGNCPKIEDVTVYGKFWCIQEEVDGPRRCLLRVVEAYQCDLYPDLVKNPEGSMGGFCKPVGQTCAEWESN